MEFLWDHIEVHPDVQKRLDEAKEAYQNQVEHIREEFRTRLEALNLSGLEEEEYQRKHAALKDEQIDAMQGPFAEYQLRCARIVEWAERNGLV